MHTTPASTVAADAASGACALESELLNSERIRERFGNCGIEVLNHGPTERRSSLYSTTKDERICRSYAVVQFIEQESAEVAEAHRKILAGDSIGATFKSTDWTIRKVTRHVGTVNPPDSDHRVSELMHLVDNVPLALHAYRLILEKGDRQIHYATIIEVHHPEYLGENELRKLFAWQENQRIADDVAADLVQRVWA